MKILKYILLVTCFSFTLVTLCNAGLIGLSMSHLSFTPIYIFEIFIVCLIIAIFIVIGAQWKIVRKYSFLYNYFVVLLVALFGVWISFDNIYWMNLLVEVVFLTIIYLGVCGMIYVIDYKDAKTINKIIEERKKRK
ncbi:MAG: hypothetical protein UFX20_15055 [Longibaculum muris]|uniref:DUF3021 family protein n=1 Tax=Longibaculum muris TaxID=1796628 RepID=A0A4R3Z2G3_9FIRM|nr:hypothetical protein [Longibaculum muris]KXU51645.1 hypothetical protein HMPREF3037_00825 [Candidatus Stoquefichus sp. KLE1796]MBS5371337.1 hypothetical protein [Coprobacillus cateniformis]MCR1888468.1 hypothetical protein [Longibaculum muris]MED9813411.1 hypothetical protein [Longibaculum muris]TCV99320.1 hypothetical protein EDD60_11010 [Longibaculum muris]